MNKKISIVIVMVLVVVVITFFFKNKLVAVVKHQTNNVVQGAISTSFYTSGTLAYRSQAQLSAELVAKVTHIFVQEGQTVEQGQELIRRFQR